MRWSNLKTGLLSGVFAALTCGVAVAQPSLVQHVPAGAVFGEPSSVTGRTPTVPRDRESVVLWIKVGPSFTYNTVNVYLTANGNDPQGANGAASGNNGTVVLTNNVLSGSGAVQAVSFVRNQPNGFGGNDDWWRCEIPATVFSGPGAAATRDYALTIKYKVAAQNRGGGNPVEIYANAGVASAYTVKLAWPGSGMEESNPGAGYPPVYFWKEEGVVGNGWINSMIDQNGTWFDVYYPGAGGVFGVGTKNEGYVDGFDTFPGGLPTDNRGQMHLNQAMIGIRPIGSDGAYWTSNKSGQFYQSVQQQYLPKSNTVRSTSTFAPLNLNLTTWDFAPRGVSNGSNPVNNLIIKRMRIANPDAAQKTFDVYMYIDPAINGGDGYDTMFWDASRGAMVAYDNTQRNVFDTGSIGFGQEYNPTTGPSYNKDDSIYLASVMRVSGTETGPGQPATDTWRDSSGDNGNGWIGRRVVVPANGEAWVDFAIVGGYDDFAGATGTYNVQMVPTIDWFMSTNLAAALSTTNASWGSFIDGGVSVDTPNDAIDGLFERGLLGTMLHFDERNGGLIAGFRNGAYPYVWPRDMAWAAVTLARTGHNDVVTKMTRYLRDVTQRDFETWTPANTPSVEAAGGVPFYGTRKGFWKQKYSTDGGVIWGAPQVDETAVVPWMIKYNYDVTGDLSYLTEAQVGNPANTNYAIVKDAAIAMSQTSKNDGTRLNHRPAFPGSTALMMYSNNVWEDQYDTFIMSNANIVRGLRDAASIATILGNTTDAADFTSRANGILAGLNAKLDWNGENTDASLLGIVYPFETHAANDPRAVRIIDRINGVAQDRFGQTKPLVRFAGQYINDASDYVGLIDRYYGDGYWGNTALGPTRGGPWFLTTQWYGMYYAYRQDFTPGTGDIDNHLYRLQRCMDHNGPLGFGAEQMAPSNSLQYAGQSDFSLQTAWPNAWESMSFYVDSVMGFLDFVPSAPSGSFTVEPKLPGAWNTMTYRNLRVGSQRFDVKIDRTANGAKHTFTKRSDGALTTTTTLRISAGITPCEVVVNGVRVTPASIDSAIGRVTVTTALGAAAGDVTVIEVVNNARADVAGPNQSIGPDGSLSADDIIVFLSWYFSADSRADVAGPNQSVGSDGSFTADDIIVFLGQYFAGCQ